MPIAANPLRILLVDDNPSDARLMLEALREADLGDEVQIVCDGVDALDHLRDSSRQLPDLILLDLNLPRKNGRELLEELKGDASLRHIPVVVLTTSKDEQDVRASYQLGANAYLTKPTEMEQLFQIARVIGAFWTHAKLWR